MLCKWAPQASHAARTRSSAAGDGFDVFLPVFLQGGEDQVAAPEQVRARRGGAAFLRAGDRMRRHELRDLRAQPFPRRRAHVALGAARIHDDALWLQDRLHGKEDCLELRDGCRDQHQVRAAHRIGNAGGRDIDHAALKRERQVGGAAAGANHLPAQFLFFQCQGKRTPDQADADNRDFLETHQSFRLAARADRNRSFSWAVPMVTRRCSGSW